MRTTTLADLLADYVYVQLQDQDNHIRWTRDELTDYVNAALRDIVGRYPESGAVTDRAMTLRAGKKQRLPVGAIRLKEVIRNIDAFYAAVVVEQAGNQIVAALGIAGRGGSVATEQVSQVVAIIAEATASALADVESYQYPQVPLLSGRHASRFTYTPAYAAYTKTTDGATFRSKVAVYGLDHIERHAMHDVAGLTTGQADGNGAFLRDSRVFNEAGTEIIFDVHAGVGSTGRVKRYDLLAQANAGGSASMTESTYESVLAESSDGRYIAISTRSSLANTSGAIRAATRLFDTATLSLLATANTDPACQHVVQRDYPAYGWSWPRGRSRPVFARDGSFVARGGLHSNNWRPFILDQVLISATDIQNPTSGIARWSVPTMTELPEPVVMDPDFKVGAIDLAGVPGTDMILAVGINSLATLGTPGGYGGYLPVLNLYFTVYDVVGTNMFQRALRLTLPSCHDVEGSSVPDTVKGKFGEQRNPQLFVSPDGAWCVVITDRAAPWMSIINLTTFALVTALSGGNIPAGNITDCLFSGDGTQFLISTGSNVYAVYNTSTWTVVGTVTFPTGTTWVVPHGDFAFILS